MTAFTRPTAIQRLREANRTRNGIGFTMSGIRKQDSRIVIPDDVERREFDGPCFACGSSATVPCRHRRWG